MGNLHRLYAVLQFAVPTVVAVDTVWSFYRVSQMYKLRLQEWRDEEDQQAYADVVHALSRIVQQCHRKDKEFWPAAVTQAFHTHQLRTPASAATEPAVAQGAVSCARAPIVVSAASSDGTPAESPDHAEPASFWQCLGLATTELDCFPAATTSPAASSTPTGHLAACATSGSSHPPQDVMALAAAGSTIHDPYGSTELPSPDLGEAAGQQAGSTPCGGVVLHLATLKPAWDLLVGGILALSQPAHAARTLHISLAERYHHGCCQLDARLSSAAGALRRRWEASVPWPQVQLRRRSALRYRVEWHGIRWPEKAVKDGGLELVLDGM